MSIPIKKCLITKAIDGDEQAYKNLLESLEYNMRCGHMTWFPCDHNPPCRKPTDLELLAFNLRVDKDLKQR